MVKGIHPEHRHGERDHNDVPMRNTTHTGIATAGAGVLSFRPVLHPCDTKIFRALPTPRVGLPPPKQASSMIWEPPLPKHHQHHGHPPLHPLSPTRLKNATTAATMMPAEKPNRQTATQGSCSGIRYPKALHHHWSSRASATRESHDDIFRDPRTTPILGLGQI